MLTHLKDVTAHHGRMVIWLLYLQRWLNMKLKNELKQLFKPVIQLILQEIYPYIYLSVLFLLISFFLVLGIFVLLLRNNYISQGGAL